MNIRSRLRRWFHRFHTKDLEYQMYWLSILIILIFLVSYAGTYVLAEATGNHGLLECKMKELFGIPCPGCGGTRAVISTLKGKFISAVYYNVFAFYCTVVYIIFFVSQTLRLITKGKVPGLHVRNSYFVVAIVLLAVQYILKLVIPGYNV
ncbi:MAG: DUF2752 domain-containing protein [Lachnospira sp.]